MGKKKVSALSQELLDTFSAWEMNRNDGATRVDAVQIYYNCAEADVDKEGDVWIEGPMDGRWLTDRDKQNLIEWLHSN